MFQKEQVSTHTPQFDHDIEMYARLTEEVKRECEDSFFNFFVHAWDTIEGKTNRYKNNWHVGCIAEHLEAVYEYQIKKLVINVPTRYLKSQLCTVAYPAWCWIKSPGMRFISSSYSDILSADLSWKRRQLIESDFYQSYWGDKVQLVDDQNQKTFYRNKEQGFMFATSTGGTVTGVGSNQVLIDDPQKPSEAASDNLRHKSIEFWKNTLSSRFDDPKRKAVVLVMQRLHDQDLSGYFLKEYGDEVTHLKIPNQCEQEVIYTYPKTGYVKVYKQGDVLHPEREGEKELVFARRELGSFDYAAQRQQEPVPREGGLINQEWFKYYDQLPMFLDLKTISVDCAFKDLESSDYVVMQVWGQKGKDHFLIDQIRNKLGFNRTLDALASLIAKHADYGQILIEDKANGSAVIDTIKTKVNALVPISPKDSKVARLNACAPMIEAGDVYLPNPDFNTWVTDFLTEVSRFPKAVNDDQVDAMTQYLNKQARASTGKFLEPVNTSGQTFSTGLNFSSNW